MMVKLTERRHLPHLPAYLPAWKRTVFHMALSSHMQTYTLPCGKVSEASGASGASWTSGKVGHKEGKLYISVNHHQLRQVEYLMPIDLTGKANGLKSTSCSPCRSQFLCANSTWSTNVPRLLQLSQLSQLPHLHFLCLPCHAETCDMETRFLRGKIRQVKQVPEIGYQLPGRHWGQVTEISCLKRSQTSARTTMAMTTTVTETLIAIEALKVAVILIVTVKAMVMVEATVVAAACVHWVQA